MSPMKWGFGFGANILCAEKLVKLDLGTRVTERMEGMKGMGVRNRFYRFGLTFQGCINILRSDRNVLYI